MAEKQQKLKKKTEKGNPLSRQPSLVRKSTELTDICCNNSDRSMYCVSSFSRGLLKSNQECLEHFADTVTANLEFIPAAFKILTSIKCTGANKLRFNFILSEITRKIMDTLNLNMQVMHPQIGNRPKAKEIKNENNIEVIEILDDVDDIKDISIDSLKEIPERQDTVGDQVTSPRFRSNIVADKFFASCMKNLPSIDSGCDTVNTPNSNQVDGVASIDKENSQTNQIVFEKSIDKNLFIDKRDNTDTLILSGIPSCQIKSETINLTETSGTQEVKSNAAKLNIFTSVEASQFPEDLTSEDMISNSEESFSIFDLRKKSKSFRKMPHLEPIIEINPDKPRNSDLKLTPKGNLGSDEIKLNSTAKESLGSDKIKIHSISRLNVNQTLKRKIQYPYKAKKKPNIDVNQSPNININRISNKKKDMTVKGKLNSICRANVGSTKKASPKSKTFRKMPHLEPIIEISPDKTTDTNLKLATKGNPDSDGIKLNSADKECLGSGKLKIHSTSKNLNQTLKRKIHYPYKAKKTPNIDVNQNPHVSIEVNTNKNKVKIVKEKQNLVCKANVGSTKKASPKSVKNQQPSSENQQPDNKVKSKPLPEESDPESHKRAKMQSTPKASKKSANLELTKMRSVSKSVVYKKLKPSTEQDPHPDYRTNSMPLSERNESKKVAKMQLNSKAAEKSPNLESTKKKSVSKAAMNSVINKNLKPLPEESRQSDDRANWKPLSERNSLESNKGAKMQSTTKAADKSANLESSEKKSVSKATMNLVIDKRLEESRQSTDRANLKSHSEGYNIGWTSNKDVQSICEAVLKNAKLTTEGQQSDYEENSTYEVYLVPINRYVSTTKKYAEEVLSIVTESSLKPNTSRNWGSDNEEDQGQRAETSTKTNLGTCTKESLGRKAKTIRESKTKTCENNESLMEKEHGDSSRETSFLTLKRHTSSNDFDYDRNLLILSRTSPFRDSIRKPRGRGRGRGRGKSVTARNEVKGEKNGVTERYRGGSIRKPLGRQKGGGRGKMRVESSTGLGI